MRIIPAALGSCARLWLPCKALRSHGEQHSRPSPVHPSLPHTQTQPLISHVFIARRHPSLLYAQRKGLPSSSRQPCEAFFPQVHARSSGLPHQQAGLKAGRHGGWVRRLHSSGRAGAGVQGQCRGEMSRSTGRQAGPSLSPARKKGASCYKNIITPSPLHHTPEGLLGTTYPL